MVADELQVLTGARVCCVLFEGARAVGVRYHDGRRYRELRARREVILSAGAFQSPQILMLSGVGDKDELAEHGIEVVHHLPGVGKNLQDHPDFIFGYTTQSPDTFSLSLGGLFRAIRATRAYRRERRGLWTSNFAEAGAFLRTKPDLPAPDVQIHLVTALVDDHGRKKHFTGGFSCHVCLLRPRSRGTVKLKSANPDDMPLIDPAFLEHEQDLEDMVQGYKLTHQLMEAPSIKAWITKDMFTADVKTDDDIRAILRARSDTVYHPVGTCKMGVDGMAVVDPQLKVHGLEGLRVVDASIMPTLIGGNTNAPAMMIVEKGVAMLRRAQT